MGADVRGTLKEINLDLLFLCIKRDSCSKQYESTTIAACLSSDYLIILINHMRGH